MSSFTRLTQSTLFLLLIYQSHLLLRDCVLRTNFEIRANESLSWYMEHPQIGPVLNPFLDKQIRHKRSEFLNVNHNKDLPILFLSSMPIFITIHAQVTALAAGLVLLNTRAAGVLAILLAILSVLLYNLYEVIEVTGVGRNGKFGQKFWEWQGETWHCGLLF